ncbi:ZPR1 zinc-finger domain [Nakaseomyces glabratus]
MKRTFGDMSEDKLFKPVGEAANEVQEENDNGVSLTGASDAMGHPVQEIESLCMNCEKNGVTRLLLTSIPYFREVVLMSFECPHCGFKNSEIQPNPRKRFQVPIES